MSEDNEITSALPGVGPIAEPGDFGTVDLSTPGDIGPIPAPLTKIVTEGPKSFTDHGKKEEGRLVR